MRLPAKYRAVLHLFYYEGYAVAEIAHILHRPAGTVKSQLNRGRALLKTTSVSYTHLDVYKRQPQGCPLLIWRIRWRGSRG